MSVIAAEAIRVEPVVASQKLSFPWKKVLLLTTVSVVLGVLLALLLPLHVS
ncbi:MAG TPA: hypothetical protein PKN95_04205 [Verrucomicrobiota bacterium]|nr:hypothetical protein [Verrucomicrobiota bacterium]HNT13589.1 hypothetical protein [Verrucomicrobiota bacterium]